MEPFFGSGAVLLARPDYRRGEHMETICDKDGFVCNVWRALKFAPDKVAPWCDWPVNHADLTARKVALIKNEERLLKNLITDEKWFDPVMAGYWIWAASCWIGSGLTKTGSIPCLSTGGEGVHKLSQRPHLSEAGMGVQKPYNPNLYIWFRELSERLRYVRVVCGDWTRVCGGNWQDKMGTVGIFFDPPYRVKDRDVKIYYQESQTASGNVQDWALERGKKESYRIVIAGYFEEHQKLIENDWSYYRYSATGGYSNVAKGKSCGKLNRHRETLFFSPFCLEINQN